MSVTMLDAIVALVVLISAFLAMVRGFSREVLSLASWGLAVLVAVFAYPHVLPHVSPYISNEMIALVVTLAGIFIVALLIISLLTMKVADLIIDSRIGALDRALGLIFGLARAGLILAVAALFSNELIRPENRPSWIEQAASKPTLDQMAARLKHVLPSDLAEKLLLKLEKKRQTDEIIQNEADNEILSNGN